MPYHVRITPRDRRRRRRDALALDKDENWIEEHIAAPRRAGHDIFVDGQVFSWNDIGQIHITETSQTSEQLLPQIRTRRRNDAISAPMPDGWYVAHDGRDVTERFLSGPPSGIPRTSTGKAITFATNRKAVMVIYGHDKEANDALFDWLRAIGLQPREWNQLINATDAASPYIGQVLEQALEQVQAVVAFFTPDEHVVATTAAAGDEKAWRLQARPNVLIEAGMALISHPTRTVLVVLGPQELPSDLAGRHYIRLSHLDPAPMHDLATRLHQAGCDTDLSGGDWLKPDRFPDRDHIPHTHRQDNSRAPGPGAVLVRTGPVVSAVSGHPPAASLLYRLARTLTGHTAAVFGVAFSPDGTLLATASDDKTARLWDPATGNQLRTFTGHTSAMFGVAFSPDGTLLATTSRDKTAQLWDPATGNQVRTLTGHTLTSRAFTGRALTGAVFAVVFSPDGTLLATASDDKTARLWDLATGNQVRTFTGHTSAVRRVVFSPDGTLLATASRDKTARLWDLATGGCVRTLTGHTDAVSGVAFSPDGTLLATTSFDKTARLWDLATGNQVRSFAGHTAAVIGVAFSPDGTLLATTSRDKTARLWDPATGNQVRTLTGHTDAVNRVAFSPDGTLLATTSRDKTARLWA